MIANVLFNSFMWYVKTPAAPLAIGPAVFRAPHIMGSPNENKHIGNGYFLAIIKSVSFVYLSSLAVAAFDRTDRGQYTRSPPGGEELGLIFAGYVPLASQSPYSIIVYSVAESRPHLSHFWANTSFSRFHLSHFLFMYLPYQFFK